MEENSESTNQNYIPTSNVHIKVPDILPPSTVVVYVVHVLVPYDAS